MKRGGHLFVADYGMQINIMSRYGIKNYAVLGKDYRFINEDTYDYNVKVSYKKDDYYKIELVNTLNNHEQVILRNDDGVYVDAL